MPSRFQQFLKIVLFLLAVSVGTFILFHSFTEGADYSAWHEWAAAFLSKRMRVSVLTISPSDYPSYQWFPGTGFFFSFLQPLVEPILNYIYQQGSSLVQQGGGFVRQGSSLVSADTTSHRLVCTVFALLFWISMFRILWRSTRDNLSLSLLGLGLLGIGTQAGYYSATMSSDVISMSLIAFGLSLAYCSDRPSGWHFISLGTLFVLLATIRPHSVFLLVPAFVILFERTGIPSLSALREHWPGILGVTLLTAIGLLFYFRINYWFSGDFFRSSYVYGNGDFQSIDPSKPQFFNVLFVLVLFHPLYLLCGAAGVGLILFTSRFKTARVSLVAVLLCVFLQVYSTATSFACIGSAQMGLRVLSQLAIYAVPALMAWIASRRSFGMSQITWLLILICCLWSGFLLRKGPVEVVDWPDLSRFAVNEIHLFFVHPPRLLAFALLTVALGLWILTERALFTRPVHSCSSQWLALFLLCFFADYCFWKGVSPEFHDARSSGISEGVFLFILVLSARNLTGLSMSKIFQAKFMPAVSAALLFITVYECMQIAYLDRTGQKLNQSVLATGQYFRYRASFNIEEAESTITAYERYAKKVHRTDSIVNNYIWNKFGFERVAPPASRFLHEAKNRYRIVPTGESRINSR